jgi:hypothetical protein
MSIHVHGQMAAPAHLIGGEWQRRHVEVGESPGRHTPLNSGLPETLRMMMRMMMMTMMMMMMMMMIMTTIRHISHLIGD